MRKETEIEFGKEVENKEYWRDKSVLVTGGSGFLGSSLTKAIVERNPKEIIIANRTMGFDLRNYEDCLRAIEGQDVVIHLAANVGGIGYNREHPADLFFDNLRMGINMLQAAHESGVNKFVGVGTICSYPKYAQVPFKEEDLWDGYPEETNAPYGLAKKMMLVGSQALYEQHDFRSINLLPVNLYGPGDNFNPESSHVIPALIKKFVDGKEEGSPEVVVWGTGKATREFLYVDDAARGILLATESVSSPEPINLGAGFEISISDLATKIKKIVGYKGELVFDTTKPDGQPRRMLDTSKARKFGFVANTGFDEGLSNTVDWYIANRQMLNYV